MKKQNSVLEIDLNTISQNVEILKSCCKSSVKHLAVVKANAYGHGAAETAAKIAPQVDWFAVNQVNEGVELREKGIENKILVFMPPTGDTAAAYSNYELTATVSAKDHFNLLPADTEYHLLFDTGMGRLGFKENDAEAVLQLKKKHKNLLCTGLYSHFSDAHEPGAPKLKEQLKIFKSITAHFEPELLVHLCNTGGLAQLPGAHFDMVRFGIGIYGFAPGEVDIPGLHPAMRWKTYLAQVKPITKGETVSYGSTWECPEDGFLGILPVGFEDGLPRSLSGRLKVKVGNKFYPTAGIITMNYTMVYLEKQNFEAGTEAVLLGPENTAKDLADITGSIPYEVMTQIPPKVPRTYRDR